MIFEEIQRSFRPITVIQTAWTYVSNEPRYPKDLAGFPTIIRIRVSFTGTSAVKNWQFELETVFPTGRPHVIRDSGLFAGCTSVDVESQV